jgi:hypothetical protein
LKPSNRHLQVLMASKTTIEVVKSAFASFDGLKDHY